ncbi:MAG: T9SS type A sorting domain-containing protein [Bacteroidota bacterium]|nr:T9SS type A sorting domain-containing protein [Bacteroidota bacterium]MDP3146839.1 T9SS type A sorting domain-containing protein [Bacteroidota bacterium]
MKKILFSLIIVLTINNFSFAQKWTEMMRDPNANYYDIVKEFDNYWKDKSYERGKGYKAFKRWQWFVEPRVYPSGDMKFSSRGYALEQYQKYIQENPDFKTTNASAPTANWTPLGPFGSPVNGDAGRIQTINIKPGDPNTIYVGTAAGGFWMSNNGGISYTTTTDQFASCGVSDIAVNPLNTNIIYVSTGDKDAGDTHSTGVLRSGDGGLSWGPTGLTWQPSQQKRIYRLLINPINPNTLIAATSDGMFHSLNAGNTWSLVKTGYFVDAEYRPGDTTTVYAVSNGGFIKSTDGGSSYSNISIATSLQSSRLSLAVTPADDNYIYIMAGSTNNGFGGLYRSTNTGANWTLMSSSPNIMGWSTNGSDVGGQAWYDIAIDASPTNKNEITVGGVNSWKSLNGGTSWTLNTHWYGGGGKPYVHADLHFVLYTSGTTCYLGTDGGVARTTNSGSSWTTINGNMNIAQIYKMGQSTTNPNKIITGHQDNGTNLLNGASWSSVYGGDGMDCFIDWNNDNTMVASSQNGNFARSTNGGASFVGITNGLTGNGPWVAPIVQDPQTPTTYYCGYQQLFKSTNQGTTWTQLGNIGASLDEIKVSPSNPNIIYVTSFGGIWKTQNGGNTWSNINGSLPTVSGQITDLAMDNLNPNQIYVTVSGYSNGNKVFASSNGGATWTNYSAGLPNIPTNCIVYTNNSTQALYVGTDVGVYYREASMTSWIPYFNGLPNIVVQDMEIYYPTGKLRAATYARGVWETDLYSNPTAAPVSAFSTVFSPACINTPIQFNDMSGNTPTFWNWAFSGGSPSTSTVQNPSVTYTATGIYSVSLTTVNGNGPSLPYVSTISVVSTPTVLPVSASVCVNQTGNISVNTNANIINWDTGQQGLTIGVSNTVDAVYNFTASLGACSTTGSSTLFVSPPPLTPTVIVAVGYLVTYVLAGSYQWYLNGSPIVGATTFTYAPTVSGYYSIWVSNGNCSASSNSQLVTVLGLNELKSVFTNISIGPNPVNEELNLEFENSLNDEIDYEIQNNLGQTILKSKIKSISGNKAKIATQSLSNGVYFLNLKQGNKQSVYKFIKQE